MIGKTGSLLSIFLMLIMFSSVITPNLNANAQTANLAALDDGPFHTGENLPLLAIDVQANDIYNNISDPENIIVNNPSHGTVSSNIDQPWTIDYTPASNYYGNDYFTYKICDPNDNSVCSNTATVSIIVDQIIVANNPPTAVPDHYTIPAGSQGVILNVIANDTDPEHDPIHIVSVTGPACAGLIVNPDNTITWNAYNDVCSGPDSFSYTINDNQIHGTILPQQTATVSLTVTPVNHPPTAYNITPFTNQNTPVSFQLSASHIDPDPLVYTVLTQPSNGALSGTAPDLTYTPNYNFFGTDSFTYKASDNAGDSNIATVTITVNHVNQPPMAIPDRYSLNQNTQIIMNVLANDTDPDIPSPGDSLRILSVTNPSHGTAYGNLDNTITYVPYSNYFGSDLLTYTISDSGGLTSTTTISITVKHVNQPPVAVNDLASTVANTPVIISVLANDKDPDIPNPGDTLTVISHTNPLHGTAVINAGTTITYTPTLGYSGSDSFQYTISDSGGLTSTATVNVDIAVANNPPIAPNLVFTLVPGQTSQNINVLGASYDPDIGDIVSLVSFTNPSHGTVVLNPDNAITYTPNSGYYGSDSFTYTVSDNHGATATGTVSLTIVKPNSPPVAVNDAATTVITTPVIIKVLANDYDPDVGDTISVTSFTNPSHGVIVLNPDNTFTYTPTVNYSGSDSFSYTISDNHGATATATVTIQILKSTPGEIEGEGDIGKYTHFEFKVESKDGINIKGHLQYHDKGDIDLQSTSFDTIYVDSTETQGGFSGTGKINGQGGYTFQVTVTNTGPKHHNEDTFSITVFDSHGNLFYSNSGTLTKGDIIINDDKDKDKTDTHHGNKFFKFEDNSDKKNK